jgi:hypothetical protein
LKTRMGGVVRAVALPIAGVVVGWQNPIRICRARTLGGPCGEQHKPSPQGGDRHPSACQAQALTLLHRVVGLQNGMVYLPQMRMEYWLWGGRLTCAGTDVILSPHRRM